MARKPGSMYRYVKGIPATRKEYLGGIPSSRISQFMMGNRKSSFPVKLSLVVQERCQIRHNSLESARIAASRTMDKKAGSANFKLMIRVYPHVVLRENKQATGAGADRVSQGMRASYGKNVSLAARVNKNQKIITIETSEDFVDLAKEALRKATCKISSPCKVIIEKTK